MAHTENPDAAGQQKTKSRNALYVGDLDKDVDEGFLYQIFCKIGPVASIRVCRDSVTRRSLGYGYVNYITSLDAHAAEKAIELLSYTPVKGRPMRVMWADRNPDNRKAGVGNVFVKGLNPDIDSRTLHDTFEVFGAITSAKVAHDDDGRSLGYGYVQYESPEAAQSAVDRANGMLLEGKQLHVAHYATKDTRVSQHGYTNVYIKNLPPSVDTDEALKALFAKCGDITSCFLPKDDDEKLKGFAFVNFKDTDAAKKAVEDMNDFEVEGCKLYVSAAQKKIDRKKALEERFEKRRREQQENTQGRNLYVKHLAPLMDDAGLTELFEKYGNITSAKVMTDENGKSKCFGFVCFSTVDEASRALAEMNNTNINGQYIYVALAQPKALRQAQMERERLSRLTMNMGAMNLGMGMGSPYSAVGPPGMMPPQMWGQQVGTGPPSMRGMGGRGGRMTNGTITGSGRGGQRGFRGGMSGRGNGSPGGRGRWQPGRSMPPFGRGRGMGGAFDQQMDPMRSGAGTMVPNAAAALASAPPEQQKIMLGEQLYPLVHGLNSDKAAKITGMLLEMDNNEVLYLIDNPEALQSKVEEAMNVLKEHDLN